MIRETERDIAMIRSNAIIHGLTNEGKNLLKKIEDSIERIKNGRDVREYTLSEVLSVHKFDKDNMRMTQDEYNSLVRLL